MRTDVDYLKKILDKFIESKTQFINTDSFEEFITNENIENFFFHWDILLDKKLIVNGQGKLGNFYSKSANNTYINHIEVRLNDDGYNFYEALKEKDFRNKIKKDFKNISIETLELLAKKFLDNKIDKFFSNP